MWKIVILSIFGLLTITAIAASNNGYELATITAVATHQGTTSAGSSGTSYDVSVKVGNTLYVVVYTPPIDTRVVQYAAGRQLLVRVGENTITFNDELGRTSEVPILSRTSVGPKAMPAPQKASMSIASVHLFGLPGIKDSTKGTLSVGSDTLHFLSSKGTADIPLGKIEDVLTGNDSQRVIRGKLGTLSMFGPYGSGRFLSLFRSKLETVTIKYRDSEGGLHGSVFTMAVGQAEPLKQELVAHGAHSRAVIEVEASADASQPAAVEEKP